MNRLDALQYFSHGILSCYTIQCTKHKPEAFLTAAQQFKGIPADEVMIFEDALYAARTVKNAGFTLGVIADREEKHPAEMRQLADFYMEKSWDEFPINQFF